jgi:alkyl hydroperoxide reductase subunit AhpF
MTDKLLNDEIIAQVRDVFDGLQDEVEVMFFGRQNDCDYCDDTRQLLSEVIGVSDKLSLNEYDLEEDAALAQQFGVDKAPGFVMVGRQDGQRVDYGVRFSGIPAGHEFSTLIHSLILVSGRDSRLNDQTRAFLAGLTEPVHLQVFVTPT